MDYKVIKSNTKLVKGQEPTTSEILENVQANILEHHKRKFVKCLFFQFHQNRKPTTIAYKLKKFATEDNSPIKKKSNALGFENLKLKDNKPDLESGWISSAKYQRIFSLQLKASIKNELLKNGTYNDEFVPEVFEKLKRDLPPIVTLHLTHKGCIRIFHKKSEELIKSKYPSDEFFQIDMASNKVMGIWDEPEPLDKEWELNWLNHVCKSCKRREIDMMIMVADQCKNDLKSAIDLVEEFIKKENFAKKLFEEDGQKKHYDFSESLMHKPVEPFGFRDGLSEIPFWSKNGLELRKEAVKTVLDKEMGSYLVFRKLEQNVSLYHEKIREIVEQLRLKGYKVSYDFIEAQIMGRFKDGTPLALAGERKLENNQLVKEIADFDSFFLEKEKNTEQKNSKIVPNDGYSIDTCPFFSHVRKVNPRKKKHLIKEKEKEKENGNGSPYPGLKGSRVRIVRRGIPYKRKFKIQYPNGIRYEKVIEGLLFMSFQSNIRSQIGTMKEEWANKEGFEMYRTGVDPVIGRRNSKHGEEYKFFVDWRGKEVPVKVNFQGVVKLRGGAFFYTPSIKWLAHLPELVKESKKNPVLKSM